MKQQSLFDAKAGRIARDRAIEAVEEAAPVDWLDAAYASVWLLAKRNRTLTTDDVWQQVGRRPPEPRAMGPVMRGAQSAGWIHPTENYRLSKRPSCHRRPIRVWESLLCEFA